MAIQFAGKNPLIDYEKINYLITNAFYHNVKPLVIINKIDCLEEFEIEEIKQKLKYLKQIEVPLFLISAKDETDEQNLEILKLEKILKNKITVIGGPSGVGKSTLINRLQDGHILKTGEISQRLRRGKHTTRDSNIIKLKVGGYIIDTPGFSSIDIPDIKDMSELFSVFPEIKKHIENLSPNKNCKFLNCTHTHEPSCEVKKGVEDNCISEIRYEFYKKVLMILTERWKKYD